MQRTGYDVSPTGYLTEKIVSNPGHCNIRVEVHCSDPTGTDYFYSSPKSAAGTVIKESCPDETIFADVLYGHSGYQWQQPGGSWVFVSTIYVS
jgi:hypothetical protein